MSTPEHRKFALIILGSAAESSALRRQWPERIWAVEGANGIGRPVTLLTDTQDLDLSQAAVLAASVEQTKT